MPDEDYTPITTGGTGGVDFASMLAAADPNGGGYTNVTSTTGDADTDFTTPLEAAGNVPFTPITTAGVSAT
jgi:hypothetical protein